MKFLKIHNKSLKDYFYNCVYIISIGFGTGLSPIMPGTVGTLAALPFYFFMCNMSIYLYCAILMLFFVLEVFSSPLTL